MFKKIKKIVAAMLIVAFATSVISPVTAQAAPAYDPDKLSFDFNVFIDKYGTHWKSASLEVSPICLNNPDYVAFPHDYRKWLKLRLYDDKGKLIIGAKHFNKGYEKDRGCYYFDWAIDPEKFGYLSHLKEGIYTIEWRYKYKGIDTKWEKVTVATQPRPVPHGSSDVFVWDSCKYAKAYDVYLAPFDGFAYGFPSASDYIKFKTVKKPKVNVSKYLKAHHKKYGGACIKVVPICKYKGKTVTVDPTTAHFVFF